MIDAIDVFKLQAYKTSFGFFSRQLMYPEKLDFHPVLLEEAFDAQHPAITEVRTYWSLMQNLSMEEIRELYTETFDFDKHCALYMTYFKFEDAKERGQMLAKLKMLYELYGLVMPEGELPDFLPLMCEFFYAAEWRKDPRTPENFRMPILILEDGTYHLLKALEKKNSPYAHLVKGLRATLKACVKQGVAGS
ncbi:nitrate reductase molybdenum cofactor assembly chaperone [Paenibacillus physcomitrellae]|uniref:Nitrate reductase molybdenum cofactor assembly chaperone n=1 Tax=Paenibacillus physcomitrellae TaxID=1619311 RepID=A0ABQ1FTJ6_9BACL|nr:nitrate reductase molybdenum cofactor assembly chaperone [Paenibacillus physcomitrellae]GGA30263.1 nitrate reductase molybdenum cofactor assembly chaperone [Paenibacillus physcomitrellae]